MATYEELVAARQAKADAYLAAQDASGLAENDLVKVLRKAEDREQNWPNSWVSFMDQFVGEVGIVLELTPYGVLLDLPHDIFGPWAFPYFVLEKK